MSERWALAFETPKVKSVVQGTPNAGPIVVLCPGLTMALPCPDSWQAVYRMAYEQARAALAPSRFQRLMEPSRN